MAYDMWQEGLISREEGLLRLDANRLEQLFKPVIRRDLKDPRIGFVSITGVRMSPDLRQARVRVSVLGKPDEQKASIKGLVSAKGLIRHELGRRLRNLKFSPELRFELDSSIEYSVHISELLKEVLPHENGEQESAL